MREDFERMPDDTGPGFKYAALVFSPPTGPADPHPMHGGRETLAGDVKSLPASEVQPWREWLGVVALQKVERAGRIAVVRSAAKEPSILDDDDQCLRAWPGTLFGM